MIFLPSTLLHTWRRITMQSLLSSTASLPAAETHCLLQRLVWLAIHIGSGTQRQFGYTFPLFSPPTPPTLSPPHPNTCSTCK